LPGNFIYNFIVDLRQFSLWIPGNFICDFIVDLRQFSLRISGDFIGDFIVDARQFHRQFHCGSQAIFIVDLRQFHCGFQAISYQGEMIFPFAGPPLGKFPCIFGIVYNVPDRYGYHQTAFSHS
jgi:hypothetical protein